MGLQPFAHLGLALAIGLLVGVERGWRAREAADGHRTAGIRTYALSSLLGGVAALLSNSFGGWAFVALGFPFAAAFILFKQREQAQAEDYSVTDVVAALLVFALGALAASGGDARVTAAAAVVTTGLLASKGVLHSWLRKLTWPELRSALVLLAMSFVLLPVLPNKAFGPFGAVNPYELWLLTIGLAAVSFVGYGATRVFGPSRGALLGSAVGALISSTAVTLHLAREQRRAPNTLTHAAAATIAGAVMAVRICVILAVLSPVLLMRLAPPLGVFAAASILIGGLGALRGRSAPGASDVALKSPFDLGVVCKFALVLGAVMAAARILSGVYGATALLPVSAVAGLADVDAVAVTAAQMTPGGLDPRLGTYAVLLAVLMDSLSKSAIAVFVGGARFGAIFAAGTLAAAACAAVTLIDLP